MLALTFKKISKYINQEVYNDYINHLDLSTCKCTCGATGKFVRHAYYHRYIKTPQSKLKLSILRVKCKSCNATHAILHPSIIPYSQIVLTDTINIIDCNLNKKLYFDSANVNPTLYEDDIANTVKRFSKYWLERLKSLIANLNQSIRAFLNNVDSIITIFKTYHKAFMQTHQGYYYLSISDYKHPHNLSGTIKIYEV